MLSHELILVQNDMIVQLKYQIKQQHFLYDSHAALNPAAAKEDSKDKKK